MRARKTPALLLLLLAALAVLALPQSAATAPPPAPPDPSCSPGPSDCSSWHTQDVTVTWSAPPAGVTASGCGSVTISNDTGGTPVSCTWSNADGARTTTANVRRDTAPPRVSASADRGPDANGWYNRKVSISFSGSDSLSGVASCSSAEYGGPDTGGASVPGSCTDNAGNTASTGFDLKYDATPPSAEAKPERPPDRNGWYNRALTVSFLGQDAASGIEACAPPVQYRGPDAPKTALSGTCRDKAANTSQPANFEFRYDTKPPVLARVKAEIASRGVVLRWTASKDAYSFAVVRQPGLKGRKPASVYDGRARTFTDRRLKPGVTYRYTVTAYDEAGNGAVKGLVVKPGVSSVTSTVTKPKVTKPEQTKPTQAKPTGSKPSLRSPAAGARLVAPPLLAWSAVPSASYYNVQLYRDGAKIMTAWPRSPSLRLQASWTYGGRTFRLTPGRYTWYVWPGFGSPSTSRYGKLLGTRTFVVLSGPSAATAPDSAKPTAPTSQRGHDTRPPAAVSGLVARASTPSTVTLAWSPARDNVGVTRYAVYSRGKRVGRPSGTSFRIRGLECGKSYRFTVFALDAAGNRSPRRTIRASTRACSS